MSPVLGMSAAIRNGLLLLLACAAGAIDAVSYLGLGRVFTANMTGNTVLLGLALVQADLQEALRASVALLAFLGGAAAGTWVVGQGPPAGMWPRSVTVALALEWSLLGVFALGWLLSGGASATLAARGPFIVLSALAMGVQSAAARRLDVSGIATTYITGTLTSLAARLMGWRGGPLRGVRLLAAVWGIYIGGAMVAGACMRLSPELAVVFSLVVLLVVVVTAAVHGP